MTRRLIGDVPPGAADLSPQMRFWVLAAWVGVGALALAVAAFIFWASWWAAGWLWRAAQGWGG